MALHLRQSQRIDNLQSCRLFTPTLQHQKIFISPSPSPFKANKSYKTQRNWSSSAEKQRRNSERLDWSSCKTGRNLQYEDQETGNQKTFQILLRQSLRRAQNIRAKNNKKRHTSFTSTQQNHTNSTKKIQNTRIQNERVNPFDTLSQLQGKKCLIGTPHQRKKYQNQTKFRKSKSQTKNNKKQSKQLQIISDNQQEEQNLKNQPIMALGMAAKKLMPINQNKLVPHIITCNNINKIAVSTTSCFILADPTKNTYGFNLDNQNNFIRAKKKSKNLVKRANILQKEVQEQQQNYRQAKIINFKNTFAINGQLKASMTKDGISGLEQRKNTRGKVKKQQSLKISGWEVNGGWDHQTGF